MEREMQLDMALFLRVSRTLEGARSGSVQAGPEALAVLKALDDLLVALDERRDYLRGRDAALSAQAQATATESMVEETVDSAAQAEAASAPEAVTETLPIAAEMPRARGPAVWGKAQDLLYEDVLWLFKVGDNEGALISLGRLINIADGTQEISRFLEINRDKLVGLYEKLLGPFARPFAVPVNGLGDRFFWDVTEAQTVLTLAREHATVEKVLERSPMGPVKTLAMLHRLSIERIITFGDEAVISVKH